MVGDNKTEDALQALECELTTLHMCRMLSANRQAQRTTSTAIASETHQNFKQCEIFNLQKARAQQCGMRIADMQPCRARNIVLHHLARGCVLIRVARYP